jgi:hypothetical protein
MEDGWSGNPALLMSASTDSPALANASPPEPREETARRGAMGRAVSNGVLGLQLRHGSDGMIVMSGK